MKKVLSLLIIVFVFCFMVNVKADMGPPNVIKYYVTVVNKSGAQCYEMGNSGKYEKSDKIVPYGTTLYVADEVVNGKYVYVYNDESSISCLAPLSDVMIKNDSFDIKTEGVEKIEPVKAIIFADGGLNLRKGPAMSYGRIVTIPQYTVITISYKAGSYWYYTDYNGQKGWISGINQYFGYDGNDVLYDNVDTSIYDSKGEVIGTIPKLTEVTDYVNVVDYRSYAHYVNYNGIKGYVYKMPSKVDGELKVIGDKYVYEGNKVIGKVNNGETVKYSIIKLGVYNTPNEIYSDSLKGVLKLSNNDDNKKEYTVVKENSVKKLKGYIGEGLFGEKKEEKQEVVNDVEPPVIEDSKQEKNSSTTELILICVLCSIIGALTCFVVIKLVNMRKNKKGDVINETEQKNNTEQK